MAIVLIIALVIFGPKRLPELGGSLGRGMREFKSSLSSAGDSSDDQEEKVDAAPRGLSAARSVEAERVETAEEAEAKA